MHDKSAFLTRLTTAYAGFIVRNPGRVLIAMIVLGLAAAYATSTLSIEKDQLKLISQDLQEVKEVQRVIDMVGGAGYMAGKSVARGSERESDQEQRLAELEAQQAPAMAPPPPAPAPAPAGEDLVSKLRELKTLQDEGVLTADEFAAAKAQLLAG